MWCNGSISEFGSEDRGSNPWMDIFVLSIYIFKNDQFLYLCGNIISLMYSSSNLQKIKYKMDSNNYGIADPSLWPNYFSLDENNKIKRDKISQIIKSTKQAFFYRNMQFFNRQQLQCYFDESRDIYYPPKDKQPSFCRAGLHYSIPDNAVGIGLNVDPSYDDEEKWALLYHGTKPQHLISIMGNGLKPGARQAHKNTLDPWGETVPLGVYFSFWMNQSFTYTIPGNPIILQSFCQDVYVAPGLKGYTVCNNSRVSRILIPLASNRTQQMY